MNNADGPCPVCIIGIYTCRDCDETAVFQQTNSTQPKKEVYIPTHVTIGKSIPNNDKGNVPAGHGYLMQKISAKRASTRFARTTSTIRSTSTDATRLALHKKIPQRKELLSTTSTIRPTSTDDTSRDDCRRHGYILGNTIGHGAYSKVMLATVMASTSVRFPEMTSQTNTYGSVKVYSYLVCIKLISI